MQTLTKRKGDLVIPDKEGKHSYKLGHFIKVDKRLNSLGRYNSSIFVSPNYIASYIKQKLAEVKGEMDKLTIMLKFLKEIL